MKNEEKIWAYCHGELSAPERAAFEKECKQDPELRRHCKEARWLDRNLKEAYTSEVVDDESLTDSILQQMQSSEVMKGLFRSASDARPEKTRSQGRLLRWVSLAAAAGILAVVSWWPQPSGKLQFSEDLTAIAIRRGVNEKGEEVSEPIFTHCTAEEVKALLARLQERIGKGYRQRNRRPLLMQWLSPDEPVKLQLVFQELRAGKVFLEIHGESHGTADHAWSRYYPSMDDCRREMEELAEEVVQGLAAPRGE